VVENVRPGVPLVVTVFGRIVASQVQRAVQNVRVLSMADMVVPSLAGPCFDNRLLSVSRRVPIEPYVPSRVQWLLTNLGSIINPFEVSARILMAGLLGFLLILLLDMAVLAIALDESLVDVFYSATKTIVTVGPNPLVDDGPGWLKVFSALAMLAGLAFTAVFTAGVVNRLLDTRLTAIAGRRAVPRRDHVVWSASARSACACLSCSGSWACPCSSSRTTPGISTSSEPRTTAYRSCWDVAAAAFCSNGLASAARGRWRR